MANLKEATLLERITGIIEQKIRPLLQEDGGDVEIVSLEGMKLQVRLIGACSGCPRSYETLKYGIENALKNLVDEKIEVIPVL